MALIPGPNNQLMTASLAPQYGPTANFVQSNVNSIIISGSASLPATVVSVTITTTGNPVFIACSGDANNLIAGGWCVFQLYRGNTPIGKSQQAESSAANENNPYGITCIDSVGAGTYTYSLKVKASSGSDFQFGESDGPNMTVFEIR